MATPPPTTFEHIIDVLSGAAPAPHTKFISLRSPLTSQQVDQLANVIETSSLQGGLRLKGKLNELLARNYYQLSCQFASVKAQAGTVSLQVVCSGTQEQQLLPKLLLITPSLRPWSCQVKLHNQSATGRRIWTSSS